MSRCSYCVDGWATSAAGPVSVLRSTRIERTCQRSASRSSSGLPLRDAGDDERALLGSARVMARPIPLLAPVTTATLPVRLSSIAAEPRTQSVSHPT